MFYGANLQFRTMNVYMCDRNWKWKCSDVYTTFEVDGFIANLNDNSID